MAAAVAADVAAAVAAAVAVINMKNRLLLQFHITGRCNLRCKHCYRTEGDVEPLTTRDILQILEQFLQLQAYYNRHYGIQKRGHINITGGEPFIRRDIGEILTFLGEHRDQVSYGILSNGSFLDEENMALLRQTGAAFVQLSIDGDRDTHDALRAPGDYDRVLDIAQKLEKRGIPTYISFTANRENYCHLPEVAAQCRKRGITKLWSDRLVPIGQGQALDTITPQLLPDYLRTLKKAGKFRLSKTRVTMNRALQFLNSKGAIYSCSAGDSLITVDEFGTVMPCRRMPIPCGNALTGSLETIYREHPVFRELRSAKVPEACSQCRYQAQCKGGARCQAYALYGDWHRADPACPIANAPQC